MKFSAGEAAFEGFRVTRHHPISMLAWALVYLASIVVTALVAMPLLQPIAPELRSILETMMAGGQSEPSAALQAQLAYAMWATMPVTLITQAILLPALYRAIRAKARDRFAFLRLSVDELRVLAVLAILAIISLGLNQAGEMAVGVTNGSGLGVFLSVALSLLSIFLSVRLVFAVPGAFAERRIDLKAAWRMTAGLFWPLLGMAIIAGVMACIVVLLLVIVALPISGIMSSAPSTSLPAMAAAAAVLFLMSLGAAMILAIVSAPFMAAYRELTGERD